MPTSYPEKQIHESLAAEVCKPLPIRRTIFNNGMTVLAFTLTSLALLPLASVLIEILRQGLPRLKPEVFVSLPAPVGVTDIPDGFGNAIVGTLIMVGIASLISIPVGLMTGIFLSEMGKETAMGNGIRFFTSILTGIPSIIAGVFAYGVIVLTFQGFSAIAGGFALAVIMLPIVALTTEEALKLVPTSQRLASAALGANHFQTTRIIVAAAVPAITTGVLLAVARAAGETAPLLFTALFSQVWSEGLLNPTPALSVYIFNNATTPYTEKNQMAWTAAVVLVGLVLCVSILSRLVTRRR